MKKIRIPKRPADEDFNSGVVACLKQAVRDAGPLGAKGCLVILDVPGGIRWMDVYSDHLRFVGALEDCKLGILTREREKTAQTLGLGGLPTTESVQRDG